jgi:hypothetical protein
MHSYRPIAVKKHIHLQYMDTDTCSVTSRSINMDKNWTRDVKIMSSVCVTIDGVWIGEWIY